MKEIHEKGGQEIEIRKFIWDYAWIVDDNYTRLVRNIITLKVETRYEEQISAPKWNQTLAVYIPHRLCYFGS